MAGGNVRSPRQIPPTATATSREIGWKWERVSESKRHGTVKCALRNAVDAEEASACGRWGPPPGLSTRTNNPAGLLSRTPSPPLVIISELGHAARCSACRAGDADRLNRKGRAHRREA